MSTEYYILSIKWSTDKILTWWRPNNNGYCYQLDWAGRYTAEQVAANRSYYDNGVDTKAIPCRMVGAEAIRVVSTVSRQRMVEALP